MSETTHLEFHPLTFAEEPDGVTVGRADIASYVLLPTDGAALLRKLAGGMSMHAASDWYHARYGDTVDMDDFVHSLRELGFVRADGEARAETLPVRLQALGRAAFSPLAWLCYGGIVIAAVVAMTVEPVLRPSVQHVFFSPSLVAVQVVLTLVQLPALLWHESFHMLAGRRLGLPTRLGTGRRWYFFVLETELDGLLGVPRRKRYLPYLAGMLADLVLFCGLILVAAADLPGGMSWLGRLALAVAYVGLLRLAWQFLLFLRTDLYYVLTTALGCTNLHEATSAYLRRKFHALPGVHPSAADDQDWSPRDRRVAPWFAWITASGAVLLIVAAVFAVVPIGVEFAARVGAALTTGTAQAQFWDSLVSVLVVLVLFIILPLLAGRQRRDGTMPHSPIQEEAV